MSPSLYNNQNIDIKKILMIFERLLMILKAKKNTKTNRRKESNKGHLSDNC